MKNYNHLFTQTSIVPGYINSAQFLDAINPTKNIIDKMTKALKGYNFQDIHHNNGLNKISYLAQSALAQSKLSGNYMNSPLVQLIDSIQKSHEQLFKSFRTLSQNFNSGLGPVSQQANSLYSALNEITLNLTKESIILQDWDTLREFEHVTSEVATINEGIESRKVVTIDDIKRLYDLLCSVITKVDPSNSPIFNKIVYWLNIVVIVITLFSATTSHTSGPNNAQTITQQDLRDFERKVYSTQLKFEG